MGNITPLNVKELPESYEVINPKWSCLGSRGVQNQKSGKAYTIVEFLTDQNLIVGFFDTEMGKDESGRIVVKSLHYTKQLNRARSWAAEEAAKRM